MNWTTRNLFQKVTRKKPFDSTPILEKVEQNTIEKSESVSSMNNVLTPKSDDGMTLSIGDESNNIEIENDFGTNKADIHMTNPDNNSAMLEKIDQSKVFVENRLKALDGTFYIGDTAIDNDLDKIDCIISDDDTPINEGDDTPINEGDDTPINEVNDTPIDEVDDTPIDEVDDTPIDEVDDTEDEVEIYSNADLNSISSSEVEMEDNENIREKIDLILKQLFTMAYDTIQSMLKLIW